MFNKYRFRAIFHTLFFCIDHDMDTNIWNKNSFQMQSSVKSNVSFFTHYSCRNYRIHFQGPSYSVPIRKWREWCGQFAGTMRPVLFRGSVRMVGVPGISSRTAMNERWILPLTFILCRVDEPPSLNFYSPGRGHVIRAATSEPSQRIRGVFFQFDRGEQFTQSMVFW